MRSKSPGSWAAWAAGGESLSAWWFWFALLMPETLKLRGLKKNMTAEQIAELLKRV